MVLVSAHEYGARHGATGASAAELFAEAVALGADYVEFDVRRTADGVFVVQHDPYVAVEGVQRPVHALTWDDLLTAGVDLVTYAEVLAYLQGKTGAHVDLKFHPPGWTYDGELEDSWDVQATRAAVEALGADRVVVTTGRDRGIAAVRRWSQRECPELLVGLSLGGSRAGQSVRRQVAGRWSELFPARRVAASGANVVVANKWLALLGVARWSHRHELPLLVWTVDGKRELRRWLRDPRCWMVTTNRVRDAVRMRDGYRE
jgi:glycerophosphoryl diester phosphodiesterase